MRVDDRIENQIELIEVPSDDRSHLGRESLRIPPLRVEAVLDVHAVDKRAVGGMGHGKKRTELEAVDFPAEILVATVQRQIQPAFKPVGDAVRPLGDAVQRFVRRDGPWKGRFFDAVRSEVVVPGQVEDANRCKLPGVDLDLVALGKRDRRRAGKRDTQRPPAGDGVSRDESAHGLAVIVTRRSIANPKGVPAKPLRSSHSRESFRGPTHPPSAQHPPKHQPKTDQHGQERRAEEQKRPRQDGLRFDSRFER